MELTIILELGGITVIMEIPTNHLIIKIENYLRSLTLIWVVMVLELIVARFHLSITM